MLLSQNVKVKWHSRNIKHYTSKGYIYTSVGNEFWVDVKDLMPQSNVYVDILCDYCKTPYSKSFYDYNNPKNNEVINKDCCIKCRKIKTKESNLKKYGISNVFELEEVKEKIAETNYEKYGVDNYTKTEEYKIKTKQTNLLKYGVEHPMFNEEIKEKIINTCLEKYGTTNTFNVPEVRDKIKETIYNKYGVENITSLPEIKDKIKQTCLEKYGYEHHFMSDKIREKCIETYKKNYGVEHPMKIKEICLNRIEKSKITMYQNGNAPCSHQQKYIYDIIGGELNYPIRTLSLDIAFPNELIYVECDFSGHNLGVLKGSITQEEFDRHELKRWYVLKNRNWREIRIISTEDKLPSDVKIIEMIQLAKDYLNTGHSWFCFDIDNGTVKCSQYEKEYSYGKLTRIKKGSNPS